MGRRRLLRVTSREWIDIFCKAKDEFFLFEEDTEFEGTWVKYDQYHVDAHDVDFLVSVSAGSFRERYILQGDGDGSLIVIGAGKEVSAIREGAGDGNVFRLVPKGMLGTGDAVRDGSGAGSAGINFCHYKQGAEVCGKFGSAMKLDLGNGFAFGFPDADLDQILNYRSDHHDLFVSKSIQFISEEYMQLA